MKRLLFLILIQFIFSRSLDVKFYSENDWLYGRSWAQGITFYNSISYGSGLAGQSLLDEVDVLTSTISISPTSTPSNVSAILAKKFFCIAAVNVLVL